MKEASSFADDIRCRHSWSSVHKTRHHHLHQGVIAFPVQQ